MTKANSSRQRIHPEYKIYLKILKYINDTKQLIKAIPSALGMQ